MIPRGFALVLDDATAGGWSWRAMSRRTAVVGTELVARGPYNAVLYVRWIDGKFDTAWHRHPDDPVPVKIGSRALRPVLRHESAPRWRAPDLGDDA